MAATHTQVILDTDLLDPWMDEAIYKLILTMFLYTVSVYYRAAAYM